MRQMSKSDLLSGFSKEDLEELCREFDIPHIGLNKEHLVRKISESRKVTRNLLILILNRKEENVRKKVMGIKKDFYDNFVKSRIDFIDESIKKEAEIVGCGICRDAELVNTLHEINDRLEDLGDMEETLPSEIKRSITSRQFGAYLGWKRKVYYRHLFFNQLLEKLQSDENLGEILTINSLDVNERIKYYLLQARKCYVGKAYDACVVMLARAIEYSLKEFLKSKNVETPKKPVLGVLIEFFSKTEPIKKDILDKVMEVQQHDRNVGAHDKDVERYQVGKKEADHSWTAIRIILKELLSIDYCPRLEKG
jgi:HEPN domain-containing protein